MDTSIYLFFIAVLSCVIGNEYAIVKKKAEIKHVAGIKNLKNADPVSHFLSKNATADVF